LHEQIDYCPKKEHKKPPNFKNRSGECLLSLLGIAKSPATRRFFIWWAVALKPYEMKENRQTMILTHMFIGSASMCLAL
jgi:hypothetical protein